MNALEFILDLKDRMSGPASGIAQSLRGVESSLKSVTGKALSGLDRGISNTATRIKSFSSEALGTATKAAIGFGVAAAASAVTAGAAIGTFAFKHATAAEKSQSALRALIKDQKLLDETLASAKGMSNFFGSDPREIEAQMGKLVSKGYDLSDTLKIIQGAADLGALGNDAKKLVDVFGEIQGKGKVSAETIGQLAQAGIDPNKLRKELLGGLKSVTGDASKDIELAIQNGTINASQLQGAALRTITQMTGKGLGGAAQDAGKTLGGLVDQLGTVPDRLFDAANTSGAIEPLKKSLTSLVQALNPDSASGKKLVEAIGKISDSIGKLLARVTPEDIIAVVNAIGDGVGIISDVIDGIATVIGGFVDEFSIGLKSITGPMDKFGGGAFSMADVVDLLAKSFKVAGAVIGVTVGLIVQVASWIIEAVVAIGKGLSGFVDWWDHLWRHDIPDAVLDLVTWLSTAWEDLKAWGSALVDGLWEGIKKAWTGLKNGWNDLVAQLPATVADKLKIASPSKVMMELGGWTVAGFTQGINDNAGDAQSALSRAVNPPKAATTINASKTSGHNIEINITVPSGGEGLARDIASEVRRVLTEEIGGVAIETGAVAA